MNEKNAGKEKKIVVVKWQKNSYYPCSFKLSLTQGIRSVWCVVFSYLYPGIDDRIRMLKLAPEKGALPHQLDTVGSLFTHPWSKKYTSTGTKGKRKTNLHNRENLSLIHIHFIWINNRYNHKTSDLSLSLLQLHVNLLTYFTKKILGKYTHLINIKQSNVWLVILLYVNEIKQLNVIHACHQIITYIWFFSLTVYPQSFLVS